MNKHPKDWRIRELGEVAVIQTGLAKGKNNIKDPVILPYLRVANVQDGYFDLSEVKTIEVSRAEIERYRVRPSDVLMTEGGDFDKLGRGHIWKGQIDPCLHQNHIFVVRPDSQLLKPEFLVILSSSPYGRRYFLTCAKQTTNLASINATQLREFPVLLPPMNQQEEIAKLIGCWDCAIEQIENLISAKVDTKRGLMQQLLSGRKRFKEFNGQKWKNAHLGDVAIESELRNNGKLTDKSLYAVTKAYGMIPMKETVQGESVERCKVVSKDWFAYNPMRLNIGSIAKWNGEEDVMVSPDYVVFRCDETRLDPDYLNHYRRSHRWAKFVEKAGDGSVRIRIWFSHLAELKLLLPALPEQRRIAAMLNACDHELDLLREQLTELKNQKKGLMQKLLTGQIRVKIDESQAVAV